MSFFQKYRSLDQCAKIDYFRNPYEICVHTNDQNRWDSKGSSATPAKQPRLSLSTSTVNVCCCHWRRGNYFVCCGVYKGAFRASTSIWEFCSCYQRMKEESHTSLEPQRRLLWQNDERLLTLLLQQLNTAILELKKKSVKSASVCVLRSLD